MRRSIDNLLYLLPFSIVALVAIIALYDYLTRPSPLAPGPVAPQPPTRPAAEPADPVRTEPVEADPVAVRRLFEAIRHVESGGDDLAVGDGGRSVGPYQCGLLAWLDGGGRREDWPRLAHDRAATERVMLTYWRRYGAVTDEQRARQWNGGPRGMTKPATEAYWRKVKGAMR